MATKYTTYHPTFAVPENDRDVVHIVQPDGGMSPLAQLSVDASGNLTGLSVTGTLTSTGALTASSVAATATLKSGGYTVATLPAGAAGMRAYVTDATTPTWNAALVGGGAVVCPAFHNGTAWVSA